MKIEENEDKEYIKKILQEVKDGNLSVAWGSQILINSINPIINLLEKIHSGKVKDSEKEFIGKFIDDFYNRRHKFKDE